MGLDTTLCNLQGVVANYNEWLLTEYVRMYRCQDLGKRMGPLRFCIRGQTNKNLYTYIFEANPLS